MLLAVGGGASLILIKSIKIMKKLLITTVILGSLFSSLAMAKTEGNYVGVDILSTNFESFDANFEKHDESSFGFGVNYKYAINFNNFFIAPGIFLNHNNASSSFADLGNGSYDIDTLKYSYGAKVDLGYDINDKIAAFVTGGYLESRIELTEDFQTTRNITEESFLYGGGVKYSVTNDVDVNIAYEHAEYDIGALSHINDFDIDTIKVGASYKF